MKIWGFRPTGDVLTGAAVGASVLVAPVILPLAWSAVRPAMKAILKCGFLLYETGRRTLSEVAHEPRRVRAKEAGAKSDLKRIQSKRIDEEAVIGQVRAAEERATGGRARPKQPAKKVRKEPGKKGGQSPATPA